MLNIRTTLATVAVAAGLIVSPMLSNTTPALGVHVSQTALHSPDTGKVQLPLVTKHANKALSTQGYTYVDPIVHYAGNPCYGATADTGRAGLAYFQPGHSLIDQNGDLRTTMSSRLSFNKGTLAVNKSYQLYVYTLDANGQCQDLIRDDATGHPATADGTLAFPFEGSDAPYVETSQSGLDCPTYLYLFLRYNVADPATATSSFVAKVGSCADES